jgi:hypothetical protein
MRLCRRIANAVRFDALSDIAVRRLLSVPSLDCIIRRRRLQHLSAIIQADIGSLVALLAATDGSVDKKRMPWTLLIIEDMRQLQSYHMDKLTDLGDPVLSAHKWHTFIRTYPMEWKVLVRQYTTFCSICDRTSPSPNRPATKHLLSGMEADATVNLLQWPCPECAESHITNAYQSNKALQAHRRVKHGSRIDLRSYVDDSGCCPVCRTRFATRLRVIAHLSEQRRRGRCTTTCGQRLYEGQFHRLAPERVKMLDLRDTEARRAARRSGRVQPIVPYAAKRTRRRAQPDNSSETHVLEAQRQSPTVKRRRITGKTHVQFA